MEVISPKGKQKLFCDNYLANGLNATKAYIDAGYKVKSEATARTNASRLLTNANVRRYLSEKMKILEDQKVASATEVLQILTKVARGERPETVAVTTRSQEPIDLVSAKGEGYTKLASIERVESYDLPTKNTDIVRASETLGKYYALWTDKVDLDGEVSLEVVVDYGDENKT